MYISRYVYKIYLIYINKYIFIYNYIYNFFLLYRIITHPDIVAQTLECIFLSIPHPLVINCWQTSWFDSLQTLNPFLSYLILWSSPSGVLSSPTKEQGFYGCCRYVVYGFVWPSRTTVTSAMSVAFLPALLASFIEAQPLLQKAVNFHTWKLAYQPLPGLQNKVCMIQSPQVESAPHLAPSSLCSGISSFPSQGICTSGPPAWKHLFLCLELASYE